MVRILSSLLLLIISFVSHGATTLDASVDKSKIYETDTINLRITGNVDMEFSFGGLMNFGRNQIESPDLPGLESNFEILDRQQSYNMRSVNGETKAQVTWTYSLAPKGTGTFIIPRAKYKDAESQEISIRVLEGKAPQDSNNPPTVFMEVDVDKSSIYVQEQVLYSVRLYSAGRLASGNLSEPESSDAIIEAFGETKKYYRMAYNQRYEVIERQYLLFPQKSGELTIEPHTFDGMLIDSQNRRRLRIREKSDPINLSVKPPPASFTGKTWLPATSLHLSDNWQGEPGSMLIGDSITRNIDISALGLLGSALPPINMNDQRGLKIYPDQPKTESLQHESGAQSIRKQSTAIVAVSASNILLPEINLPWWDTINDVERIATIPAQEIIVKPNPVVPNLQSPEQQPSLSNELNPEQAPTHSELETKIIQSSSETHNQAWYTLVILLVIGWISTTLILLKRLQSNSNDTSSRRVLERPITLDAQQKNLIQAIKKDDMNMPNLLIQWAKTNNQTQGKVPNIQSIQDLKQVDEVLFKQATAFEQQRYAQTPEGSYDQKLLIQSIKSLSKNNEPSKDNSVLRPMFP